MKAKKIVWIITILIFLALGLFYRLYGLSDNHSFWNDENQTAIFARAILEWGFPVLSNGYTPSIYLPFWYYLPAFFMKIMGVNEFAVRLPSIIFGSLSIWVVFLLGREMFNRNVGLLSALFITFLKIEILWSRQARPYQLIQLLYLLSVYFFLRFVKQFDKKEIDKLEIKHLIWAVIFSLLAAAIHPLGLLLFVYFAIYLFLFRRDIIKEVYQRSNKIILLVVFLVLLGLLWRLNLFVALKNFIYGGWGKTVRFYNYLYYYRVFLWQNYSLISILSFLGLVWALVKKIKLNIFFVILLAVHLGFISFRLSQPFVRYFYPVFPFLIIFFSYALEEFLAKIFKKENLRLSVIVFLAFMMMIFNHKFSLWPQKVYSLNEDMQEIPEVDYQKLYSFISKELLENSEAVFISNWNDHAVWYLGEGKLDYILRTNPNSYTKDPLSDASYIDSVEKLKKIVKDYSQGLVLLESWESELPEGTRGYIRSNLKKEFETDRLYPIQPRFWPVEVYSWGLEKN